MNLHDADGDKIGTTVTTARGEYCFDSVSVRNRLVADRTYTVQMLNPADYQAGGLTVRSHHEMEAPGLSSPAAVGDGARRIPARRTA
ncbi:hypothetical protein [Nonomuraea dietziae]|uniref:hypothetical protein n=1 Tax=Nonomuraea dietziae TaxID=65515 RepID=UPI00340490BD